jgi:hypothetical protein
MRPNLSRQSRPLSKGRMLLNNIRCSVSALGIANARPLKVPHRPALPRLPVFSSKFAFLLMPLAAIPVSCAKNRGETMNLLFLHTSEWQLGIQSIDGLVGPIRRRLAGDHEQQMLTIPGGRSVPGYGEASHICTLAWMIGHDARPLTKCRGWSQAAMRKMEWTSAAARTFGFGSLDARPSRTVCA